MSKDYTKRIVIVLFLVLCCSIYGFYKSDKSRSALKNSDEIIGEVIGTSPSRSHSIVYVTYSYKGSLIHNDFSVNVDSFKKGDKLLLKVSREFPSKYIEFLRKEK